MKMNNTTHSPPGVRIVTLPPGRMACYQASGEHPELAAWKVLLDWAEKKGLLASRSAFSLFGFDNPPPSSGHPVYGYEVWITVGPETEAEGPIKIKDFPGGTYAVTHTELDAIGESWKQLVRWVKAGPYDEGAGQCLEEHLSTPGKAADPQLLSLYLPISET